MPPHVGVLSRLALLGTVASARAMRTGVIVADGPMAPRGAAYSRVATSPVALAAGPFRFGAVPTIVLALCTATAVGDMRASAIVTPYCLPGVSAARCRGVFWETGALYKKPSDGTPLSQAEYTSLLTELRTLRARCSALRDSDEGGSVSSQELGGAAAAVRAQARMVGGALTSALAGDERYESRARLNQLLASLDDLDASTLNGEGGQGSRALLAPGFSPARLLLDSSIARFDELLATLPSEPDPDP